MKVLQVNCVYKKGSTGKITYDLHHKFLDMGIESVVCYGRGKKVNDINTYKVCPEWYSKINNLWSRFTGIMYGGCFFSTRRLIGIIKKEKPDVVHLQCINGYFVNIYKLIDFLKRNKIKTLLTLHGEFMYTGGCGHAFECNMWRKENACGTKKCPRWRAETKSFFFDGTKKMLNKMEKAFEGFDEDLIVSSVSPWLMRRAKSSLVLVNKRHYVVFNGLDTDNFCPGDTTDLRSKQGLQNKKIVFHATPLFNSDPNYIKGGYYIIELAKMMPDVIFVIAGNYEAGIKVPANILLLGKVADQKMLSKYYSMADVTVIASKRETFSMVTAESLCAGTPVVGFKAGGPENIAIKEFSTFVEYGDMVALKKAVTEFIDKRKNPEIAKIAKETYSSEKSAKNYIALYNELLK